MFWVKVCLHKNTLVTECRICGGIPEEDRPPLFPVVFTFFMSNSFDLSPSCTFVRIQTVFFFSCGPLKCPLVEVKELCGMFPNSFNGFQVFWATSQTASTPTSTAPIVSCVIGLPVLHLKLFIAFFFLNHIQDLLLF